MAKHENTGHCTKCSELFESFPGFHTGLYYWFIDLQSRYPDAHISCAGRGRAAQEECFIHGLSKAHFGESAHNYNAAIDLFQLGEDKAVIYNKNWFQKVVGNNLNGMWEWYGAPGAKFREMPHVEVKNWKFLVKQKVLTLVE